MHAAVFSFLMALVTTCVTALASSNLPAPGRDDEPPILLQPGDDDPGDDGHGGPEQPIRSE